jgi:glucosamine--fructose-6-phosphate aminotransferase (isomerizing)
MPFISFDEEGVCSYCRDYDRRGSFLKGEAALEEYVAKFRSDSHEPDCIVGFSGGRDSAYGLNYIKNHLGLHPITFTYDWGMVNDLARRNQARVVGKLGIEHIVISADIKKKRENIRKNLKAWLKKPDLGMVPLLMAGDKQFYYYFHKVRKQTGVKLFLFCGGYEGEEGTGLFKYGFCNVQQGKKRALKMLTNVSRIDKLKIMLYYLKQYVKNPAYVNKSIFDTLFAYYSTYMVRDDYVYLFHYLDWDEKKILSTISEKFNWEKETDTIATWRTDDGTAAIYNYIYLSMAGFTEFDIFRSHQIREGKLSREDGYAIVKKENMPRFKSIEWYGQTINFDMNKAIETINSAPKLYKINTKGTIASKACFVETFENRMKTHESDISRRSFARLGSTVN